LAQAHAVDQAVFVGAEDHARGLDDGRVLCFAQAMD
jgi:hypothetical protein